jgi:hypothetical protein
LTTPNFILAFLRLQAIKEGYIVLEVSISRTDDPSSQYKDGDEEGEGDETLLLQSHSILMLFYAL